MLVVFCTILNTLNIKQCSIRHLSVHPSDIVDLTRTSHKGLVPQAPIGLVFFGTSFLVPKAGPNSSSEGQAC